MNSKRGRPLFAASLGCRTTAAVAICLIIACASQPAPTPEAAAHSALSQLRGALLVDIVDKGRAQEAAALVDQIQEQDSEARDTVAHYRQRLRTLDANYDATEDDFSKLFADFNQGRLMHQHQVVDLWTRMAGLTTDAEWKALGNARVAAAKALTAAR